VSELTQRTTRFARTAGGSSIAHQIIGDRGMSILSVPPMAT
jgi:hypothetical protein